MGGEDRDYATGANPGSPVPGHCSYCEVAALVLTLSPLITGRCDAIDVGARGPIGQAHRDPPGKR